MVSKIILYSGVNEHLFFSYVNKTFYKELADRGVFYAEDLCSTVSGSSSFVQINELCEKYEDSRLLSALQNIKNEANNCKANTLCFGLLSFRPSVNHLNNLVQACKYIFSNAKQNIVLDNSLRYDIICERYYSYISFRLFNTGVSIYYNSRKIIARNNLFSNSIKYLLHTFDRKGNLIMTIEDVANLLQIDIKSQKWINNCQHLCFPIIPREGNPSKQHPSLVLQYGLSLAQPAASVYQQ